MPSVASLSSHGAYSCMTSRNHALQGSYGEPSAAETRAAPVVAAVAGPDDSGSTSADEMTCSICLQHTELEEIASISPGCGHAYCGEQLAVLSLISTPQCCTVAI
jgi:hypothetical protein